MANQSFQETLRDKAALRPGTQTLGAKLRRNFKVTANTPTPPASPW